MFDNLEEAGWRVFWSELAKGKVMNFGDIANSATFVKVVIGGLVGIVVGGTLGERLAGQTKIAQASGAGPITKHPGPGAKAWIVLATGIVFALIVFIAPKLGWGPGDYSMIAVPVIAICTTLAWRAVRRKTAPSVAPAASVAVETVSSRRCPYCAEAVKLEAIICKHCGKDIPATAL